MIKKERNSGIELLKVIAIILIVTSHVTQTLLSPEKFSALQLTDGYIEIGTAVGIKEFVLILFRHCGAFGNLIFIICSSFFLTNLQKINYKKIASLWINTFIISVLFLLAFFAAQVNFDKILIIKSLFPVFFRNNWFITVYLIFCVIVPFLNVILDRSDQKQLFRAASALFLLCFVINFVKPLHDINDVVTFITIYFVVCYHKKYLQFFWSRKKNCSIVLFVGLLGFITLLGLTVFCTKISFLQNKQFYWAVTNNPFLFAMALALFFLFKQFSFKNEFINTVSSFSLYIYLMHENILFRNYTRVHIWHYIYEKTGHAHIITEVIIYTGLLFTASAILSYLYTITFEKLSNICVKKLFHTQKIRNTFHKIENTITGYK